MRPLALLAALVALAGCLQPGTPEQGAATVEASGPWTFASGLVDADVYHTGEPSIAIDPRGVEYVCAPAGAQRPAENDPGLNFVWRSVDGGATFARLPTTGREEARGGGDCDIATDDQGALYEVGLNGDPTGLVPLPWSITFTASDDGGRTWRDSRGISLVPVVDRQWVATHGRDVFVTWQQVDSGIWVARSSDGGRSFSQTLAMPRYANADLQRYFIEGPLRVAPDGTLFVPDASQNACDFWGCFNPGDPVPPVDNPTGHVARGNVAVSTDNGASWTIKPTKAPTGWAFAVDRAGNLYSGDIRCDRTPDGKNVTGCAPQVWVSTDQGDSWTGPLDVPVPANMTLSHLWLQAGAPGRVALAFYGVAKTSWANDTDPEGDWHLWFGGSMDALAQAPRFAAQRVTREPVHQGVLHRDLVDYLSIAIDPQGRAHVAYTTTHDITEKERKGYGRIGEARQVDGPLFGETAAAPAPQRPSLPLSSAPATTTRWISFVPS